MSGLGVKDSNKTRYNPWSFQSFQYLKKKQEDILPAEEVYKTEDITQLTASSHL